MSIVAVEAISTDRKGISGRDELGRPVKTSANGFPKTVRGVLDNRSRGPRFDESGLSYTVDAVFVSETYTSGLVGDTMTTATGETFTVRADAIHRSATSARIDHAEYTLTRVVRPGVAP